MRLFLYWIYQLYLNGNGLADYTSLFSPSDLKKNDDIILEYFGL